MQYSYIIDEYYILSIERIYMWLLRNRQTRLYLNQDEMFSDNAAFDYILINPDLGIYEAIGSKEALIWKLLQHKHELSELVAHLSLETGEFEDKFVKQLLEQWIKLGLVHERNHPFWHKQPKPWWQKLIWQEAVLQNFDKGLTKLYRRFLHFLTAKPALFIYGVLITTGALTLLLAKLNGQIKLLTQIGLADFALILSLGIVILFLHEMGHAIAMKWARAEVLRAGFALYLGLPVFFVDTSTVWAKARLQRIVTASGGIIMNSVLAAGLTLAAYIAGEGYLQSILWELVLINLFMIALSSIPFVKMDGYYILVDLLGVPKLDQKAYSELQKTLRHPWPINWTKQHFLLVIYAIVSLISSLILILRSAGR